MTTRCRIIVAIGCFHMVFWGFFWMCTADFCIGHWPQFYQTKTKHLLVAFISCFHLRCPNLTLAGKLFISSSFTLWHIICKTPFSHFCLVMYMQQSHWFWFRRLGSGNEIFLAINTTAEYPMCSFTVSHGSGAKHHCHHVANSEKTLKDCRVYKHLTTRCQEQVSLCNRLEGRMCHSVYFKFIKLSFFLTFTY